jgi:lipopolysaccharide transport system ATP-binding protein
MSDDVLVKVEHVSKKFCKSLKRSLFYGARDIIAELNPFGRTQQPNNTRPVKASLTGPTTQQLPALRKDEFWAVKDVSFELKRGECLGLIGHNGAGKSTLLKMLNGIIKPDTGRIEMHGRVGALIELGAGFNPILTGRENIYNKGAIHGFTKKEMDKKFDAIVDFSETAEFIDMPVQNYSSGMKVRLGFAVCAQMDPDVLIIDEVLAVGDLGFRIKCLNAIGTIVNNAAVIFVSHSMPMVSRISSSIMLMGKGSVALNTSDIGNGIDSYYSTFSSGEKRISGTGKIKLVDVYCNPITNDQSMPFCDYHSEVSFVMTFSTDSIMSNLSVGVVIWNQELRPVADLAAETGQSYQVSEINECFSIKLTIPSLDLNHGKHTLAIIVSDIDSKEIYLRVDNALTFQVRSIKTSWADVILPCKWSMV